MAYLAVSQQRLPSRQRLARQCEGLHPGAPVVIMLHGFKYDPANPRHDPNLHIYALDPSTEGKRAASWPRRLGLRGPRALAIGFGWRARGTIWQAHARAAAAGVDLARLIQRLRDVAPDRPIHLVAHSLGARVALAAIPHLAKGAVDRVILIAAAAFECELRVALQSPAGAGLSVINQRSSANTLFDLLLRAALPHWGPTLGRGRIRDARVLDLPIDQPAALAALGRAGFAMSPRRSRVCHWSGYLREDVCALNRALLHRPEATPLPYLQGLLSPSHDKGHDEAPARRLPFLQWLPF